MEDHEFEEGEVYAIDMVVSTGEGKAKVRAARLQQAGAVIDPSQARSLWPPPLPSTCPPALNLPFPGARREGHNGLQASAGPAGKGDVDGGKGAGTKG